MEPIGRMMTNLERLDFYQGADFEGSFTYAWFRAKHAFKHFLPLFRGLSLCLRLQELHLDCHGWFLGDFEDFVAYFPQIKCLKIESGELYVFGKEKKMYRTTFLALNWLRSLSKLEELEFKSFHLMDCGDDEQLSVFDSMQKLRKLEINACTLIQHVGFLKKLHEILPSLETLVIHPFNQYSVLDNRFNYGRSGMYSEVSQCCYFSMHEATALGYHGNILLSVTLPTIYQ